MTRSIRLLTAACLALALGCFSEKELVDQLKGIPSSDILVTTQPIGAGVGESCADAECRDGLGCTAGTCQPDGSRVIGESCFMAAECQPNAFCGPQLLCALPPADGSFIPQYQAGTTCVIDQHCKDLLGDDKATCLPKPTQICQPAGSGTEGQACTLDNDCEAGLSCSYEAGFVGACATRGTVDVGGDCATSKECYPGLVCGAQLECITFLEALTQSTAWPGADCGAEDAASPRVYFELPGDGGTPKTEFYRLPYPNVLRQSHAGAGHPLPGRGPLDFDPLKRLMDAAEADTSGAGVSPTVFFQFSTAIDFGTVNEGGKPGPKNLIFVNVDATSPGYKNEVGYGWGASSGRTKYLCSNYLTVHNGAGSPLEPNTTYAVLLLKGIRMANDPKSEMKADADLTTLLKTTQPPGAAGQAWTAYAPLRQYLTDAGILAGDVIGAAVFRTQDPTALVRAAREVVQTQSVPTLKDVVVCDGSAAGPCEVAGETARACGQSASHIEIQGRITLPAFQQGTRPYLRPEDGGAIQVVDGKPAVVGPEDVCFSLTIPKTPMPGTGWPIVLYAHGTNGNFRSHVTDETAALLAVLPGGGAATLGIDAPMHGPRRGNPADPNANLDADILYFNFANPPAARGNAVQSVIDYFSLAQFVRSIDGTIGNIEIKFDPAKIGFLGHSQGSTIGPMVVAFEPTIGPVLFSGAGASLVNSLLRKTKPVNIPAGVNAVLREDGSETHPVLSILQAYFDSIDPANYARLITRTPPVAVTTPHPLMVVYGHGDSYTPNQTTRIFADALEIPVMKPTLSRGPGEAFEGYPDSRISDGPFTGNVIVNAIPTTQGLCMYQPSADKDGHFVLFNDEGAQSQAAGFFDSYFTTGVATIPAR